MFPLIVFAVSYIFEGKDRDLARAFSILILFVICLLNIVVYIAAPDMWTIWLPETRPNKTGEERFIVIWKSPVFGTCTHGGCCDICDGVREFGAPYGYSKTAAERIMKIILWRDKMCLTGLRKAE